MRCTQQELFELPCDCRTPVQGGSGGGGGGDGGGGGGSGGDGGDGGGGGGDGGDGEGAVMDSAALAIASMMEDEEEWFALGCDECGKEVPASAKF